LDVLQDLAKLGPHVALADDPAVAVESHLPLQMNNPPIALDHRHGEWPEGRPDAGWINGLRHGEGSLDRDPALALPALDEGLERLLLAGVQRRRLELGQELLPDGIGALRGG